MTAVGQVTAQSAAVTGTARGPGRRKIDDRELLDRFPPRAVPAAWPVTLMGRDEVWGHLIAAPFPKTGSAPERARRRGMAIVLGWLADQPGGSWQDRWLAAALRPIRPPTGGCCRWRGTCAAARASRASVISMRWRRAC